MEKGVIFFGDKVLSQYFKMSGLLEVGEVFLCMKVYEVMVASSKKHKMKSGVNRLKVRLKC